MMAQAPSEPRHMRLRKRELSDSAELRGIIERANVLRVGSSDVEGVFITPLSFGFEWEDGDWPTFWLHSAFEGRKADAWRANPEVALELDVPLGIIEGDYTCAYSLAYESIMGAGRICLVTDLSDKVHGLEQVMGHMAPDAPRPEFSEAMLARTAVWRIDVTRLTGKRRELPAE